MTPISGPTNAQRREQDLSAHDAPHTQPTTRQIDPDALGTHVAADLAAVARNMATRAVDAGRRNMTSSASASHTYGSETEAKAAFAAQSSKLLDLSTWNGLSGRENATFDLCDPTGAPAHRAPVVGDFVRIRLPGQKQLDWVRIESISVSKDHAGILVRPSYDPTKRPLTPNVIAHFFTRETTNAFIVERDGTTVTARVEGRDESANVGERAGGLENAARNRAASETAWGVRRTIPGTNVEVDGLQQHQWNVFTENLVSSK